jgi:predicted GNAT family acetyltransferase
MNENDLTDEELEEFENKTRVVEDKWDRLDMFRKLLNSSHLEKMYAIKRAQKLGPSCPYYKKAKRLFQEEQEENIVQKMKSLLQEFTNE